MTTMCLDESVQAEMREFGLGVAKEMCSKSDRRVEGNRLTIDAVCKLGVTTMTTHSVMTFTGNTAYHTEGSATYDPPYDEHVRVEIVDRRQMGRRVPAGTAAGRHHARIAARRSTSRA